MFQVLQRLLRLATVAVALTATIVSESAPAWADVTTIRTIKQPLAYYAPLFVAAAQGFDKKNNLNLQFVTLQSGAQNLPALFNNTVDIGYCSFDGVSNLWAQGKQAVSIYELVNRITLDLVISDTALKTMKVTATSPVMDRIKALKGLKFGMTLPGAPSDIFLRGILLAGGLDPDKDVDILRIGSFGGLVAAMKTNQISGFLLSPPSSLEAQKDGYGSVLIKLRNGDLPAFESFPFLTLCAPKDYVDKNPAVITAFVKTVQQSNDWMRAHPDETVKILQAAFPDVDPNSWPDALTAMIPAMSKDGRMSKDQIQKAYLFYKQLGVLTTEPPSANEGVTWTNSFLGR